MRAEIKSVQENCFTEIILLLVITPNSYIYNCNVDYIFNNCNEYKININTKTVLKLFIL